MRIADWLASRVEALTDRIAAEIVSILNKVGAVQMKSDAQPHGNTNAHLSAYEAQLKLMEIQKPAREARRRDEERLSREFAYSETKKKMDKLLEFQQRHGLLIDRWYWVKVEEKWFPACWDKYGWSNSDCWEATFEDVAKVEEWKLIPLPEELP
jgi:hypothetical protein